MAACYVIDHNSICDSKLIFGMMLGCVLSATFSPYDGLRLAFINLATISQQM